MIDIEKLAKEHCHHQQSADQFSITLYGLKQFAEAYHAEKQRQEQEPVGWMNSDNGVVIGLAKKSQVDMYRCFNVPLYTTPPNQSKLIESQAQEITRLKEMLDEQKVIITVLKGVCGDMGTSDMFTALIRKDSEIAELKKRIHEIELSLQEHDNEVIERCARIFKSELVRNEIRSLKGK